MSHYLTPTDVAEAHALALRRYGGSAGLRDGGLLASALFRPQSGYYADVIAEAAALWESLSQNHPFVDGNKRTAYAAMIGFLAINGWTLPVDDREAQRFVLGLYREGRFRFSELENWLRNNAVQR